MGQCHCNFIDKTRFDELRVKGIGPNEQNEFKLEFDAHCKLGYGQGKRPFQDAFFGMGPPRLDNCYIFCVFDGFGPNLQAAHVVRNYIELYFEERVKRISACSSEFEVIDFLNDALVAAEDKLLNDGFDYSMDGTCCCFAYISEKKCIIVNLGNCQAYLYRRDNTKVKPIRLCQVHDLANNAERQRILSGNAKLRERENKKGGRFYIDETQPGITATRGIGAFKYKKLFIAEPEVETIDLDERDLFIVMATDGLWDVMTPEEVGEFVLLHEEKEGTAEDLLDLAGERWKIINEDKRTFIGIGDEAEVQDGGDDITAVITFL